MGGRDSRPVPTLGSGSEPSSRQRKLLVLTIKQPSISTDRDRLNLSTVGPPDIARVLIVHLRLCLPSAAHSPPVFCRPKITKIAASLST
ncbi:hypothetical protein V6N13_091134 [Hibiscus sabdariffa]|uniref:Uncharacterized protein n=1 Tax=Hibiscus sabdariffa TaxID=183260 RepID=A0ABR2R2Y7_9ROSI